MANRKSGFKGTFEANRRPVLVVTPDAYITIQSETQIPGCGECNRKININDYVTGWSTDGSVDSPPANGSVNLTIPDNDINNFYANGSFAIGTMMEIEIYAKGYYTKDDLPQYYRVFWGMITQIQTSWSNGITTVTLTLRDILEWWALTNITLNPAFLNTFKTSSPGYNLWGNQFAGKNPYAVMIKLASEVMGDMSFTTVSFTRFSPEAGSERKFTSNFMDNVLSYWREKFSKLQNNLIIYGLSGARYPVTQFADAEHGIDPNKAANAILEQEDEIFGTQLAINSSARVSVSATAVYRKELSKAGGVEFFQYDTKEKIRVAQDAKDQIGYEFYCDTNGDIIFKPPFYNMDVYSNKPYSWVQNFELIDDSITESSQEVVTHITSSGNAFGGVMDWGLNDGITTPHTGVYDYHLLKRYGWRRHDFSVEWAGNPRTLFYFLLDMLDKLNSKRTSGSVTIPMRSELKMGFPIYVEKYDSFFYINGISHAYSVGGQATTTLNLSNRRSKFIAPENIGRMQQDGTRLAQVGISEVNSDGKKVAKKAEVTQYKIEVGGQAGTTSGFRTVTDADGKNQSYANKPLMLRDKNTGKLQGFPNVVMFYHMQFNSNQLENQLAADEAKYAEQAGQVGHKKKKVAKTVKTKLTGTQQIDAKLQKAILDSKTNEERIGQRDVAISAIRNQRYETGATNAGAYDYVHDVSKNIMEFTIVPASSVTFGNDELIKTNREALRVATAKNKTAETAYVSARTEWYNIEKNKGATKEAKAEALDKASLARDAYTASKALVTFLTGQDKITASNLSVMIRPVSDERGFEVIGHYRYGRGAQLIDGQIQDTSGNSHRLDVQIPFASTGTLVRNISVNGKTDNDLKRAYYDMRPETAASFTGKGIDGQNSPGNPTGSAEDGNIKTDKTVNVSETNFLDAKSLLDMTPTVDYLGVAVESCSCGLDRPDWVRVLPKSAIAKIAGQNGYLRNDLTKSGFFDILNKALLEQFQQDYKQGNAAREKQYSDITTAARVERIDPTMLASNSSITTEFTNLIARARANDPTAIKELKAKIDQSKVDAERLNTELSQLSNSLFDVSKEEYVVEPIPSYESLINVEKGSGS